MRRIGRHPCSAVVHLGVLILITGRGVWAGEGISLDTWPKSWFKPPRTASELGIKRFRGSPMLAERVAAGELPPVEERLPKDPIVIEPAERVGKHGGTARVFFGDARLLRGLEPPLIMGPAVHKILPNLARGWEYQDGGRELILYLRAGAKWSDGHPITAADYVFWFNQILMNKEMMPVLEPKWQGSTIAKLNDLAVKFRFARPHPFFVKELAHHGDGFLAPAHFLKDYHPDFVPKDELESRAKREGYISWMAYFNAIRGEGGSEVFGTPML